MGDGVLVENKEGWWLAAGKEPLQLWSLEKYDQVKNVIMHYVVVVVNIITQADHNDNHSFVYQ